MNTPKDSEIDADPLENTWYSKKNALRDEDSRGIRGNVYECTGTHRNDSEIDADPLENSRRIF